MFLFALIALASAVAGGHQLSKDLSKPAETFLSKIRYSRRTKELCSVHVVPYPLNGMRFQQANDNSTKTARSHYDKFSIRQHHIQNKATVSQSQVAIEYKKPMQELLSGSKRVKINFYNLLFTASLRVSTRDNHCQGHQFSLLGFVELVKTDMTWYRSNKGIIQHRGKNLAEDDHLQYVITKSNQQSKTMFANDSAWARTIVMPIRTDYIVPFKYESTERIEVDFEKYPNTVEYEKLIEKKIFLVQTNLKNEVLDVISGVDVMIYLDYETVGVTKKIPRLHLTNSHGLIRQIANPEKYANVLTDLQRKGIESVRDIELIRKEWLPSSRDTTLNPLPKSIHIYTE